LQSSFGTILDRDVWLLLIGRCNLTTQDHTIKRILIVDDEEAVLFSYKKLLQGPYTKVDICADIESAFTMLRDNDYSAVVTDLRLASSEGEEGLEILRYVRSRKPDTPVLVLTGYGSDEIKKQVLAAGNTYYFSKPLSVSELNETLKHLGLIVGR
jgi:DNA-binding response OmpR family regulator